MRCREKRPVHKETGIPDISIGQPAPGKSEHERQERRNAEE